MTRRDLVLIDNPRRDLELRGLLASRLCAADTVHIVSVDARLSPDHPARLSAEHDMIAQIAARQPNRVVAERVELSWSLLTRCWGFVHVTYYADGVRVLQDLRAASPASPTLEHP